MAERTFGAVNDHVVGVVMEECIRRATRCIKRMHIAAVREMPALQPYPDDDEGLVVDRAAQEIYISMLRACFPTCGIIAEEGPVIYACNDSERDLIFSVDPVDGSNARQRQQSYGVGTMIACAHRGEIIAAYIADVNTNWVYGFAPHDGVVRRTINDETTQTIAMPSERSLDGQHILFRARGVEFMQYLNHLEDRPELSFAFRMAESARGGIGIGMTRLWKGEVGGVVLSAGRQTPWDMWPIIGICRKLGCTFVRWRHNGTSGRSLETFDFPIRNETFELACPTLVVHASRLPELVAACERA